MASTIGIRIYQISIHKKGTKQSLNGDAFTEVRDFITSYIKKHSTSIQDTELERSWYFQIKEEDNPGNCRGYIHYGTFGFESNFVDAKTKKHNYRRKITDVEEIPLYFEFWIPEKESFGFVAFQSFQGRSCINLVMAGMKVAFEKIKPDTTLTYKKLFLNDPNKSFFSKVPVKRLRLIKRDAPSDLADRYFNNPSPDSINFEIAISARRNKSLGDFGNLFKSLKTKSGGVISYNGIEFPEAVAELRFGNRTRKVGVLGLSTDAGVIDITDDIKRGPNGHPTFESIANEADEILQSMYDVMRGDEN